MTAKPTPVPPTREPRPVVSPDLLEKLQQPVEQISRPPEPRPIERKEFRLASAQPAIPSQDAAAKLQGVAPVTAIQTSAAQGNPYWTLIRQRINSKWVAPPVDLTQRSLQAVIRFKLDRAGKVSDIMVEQSSGNDYYDNAGKRAVLAADPLPPFPSDITERQITTHFIFTVGEQAG
jgi:TonB family protein